MMTETPELQHLVACVACHRQFDVSAREPGSRFHCACGEIVEVRPPRPHESDVVRCSACGAPRIRNATACGFCNSDFTLHERDLSTICPGCATRISRKARYCHACALPIAPQPARAERVEAGCPACGREQHLTSRALAGDAAISVLECPRCAGMWLSGPAFKTLEERSRDRRLSWTPERDPASGEQTEVGSPAAPLYRPCPDCGKLMNRRNYGRRSGVVIDVCSQHGVWFDLGELARILSWIRDGGLEHAQERERLRARTEARRPAAPYWRGALTEVEPRAPSLATLLHRVLSRLFG